MAAVFKCDEGGERGNSQRTGSFEATLQSRDTRDTRTITRRDPMPRNMMARISGVTAFGTVPLVASCTPDVVAVLVELVRAVLSPTRGSFTGRPDDGNRMSV